jgi:hypothetical protein
MTRITIAHLLLILSITFFCIGCGGSGFMEKEKLSSLHYNSSNNNSIIFHNTEYTFTGDGILETKSHYIFKAGKNSKSLPEILMVHDGSVEKLLSYHSRLIKKDGTTSEYNKGDLLKYNLSGIREISENYLWYLPVDEELSMGDIIETVTRHEFMLPQLGINYSVPLEANESNNVSCRINVPASMNLNYKVVNDVKEPVITVNEKENIKSYLFEWDKITRQLSNNPFGKKRNMPGVLASLTSINDTKFTWKEFGNWYLGMISEKVTPDEKIRQKALEITAGISGDLNKMDAIFYYCQKNIRYEQVYLDKGEFIPNQSGLILSRKYGDCKDYTTLIVSLARSIELNPSLAICYRGRGQEEFYDIPVSQFNHVLVYYNNDGKEYWYDGTNRSGTPGLPTTDLINQTAVVLEKDNSHIVNIKEHQGNCMIVDGKFNNSINDLDGELKIKLDYEYAIDFQYCDFVMGKTEMNNFISAWLKENINDLIETKELAWSKGEHSFDIVVRCRIPNSIITIDRNSYVSISKIFNKLILHQDDAVKNQDLFYYPGYSNINVMLNIKNLFDKESDPKQGFKITGNYRIEPGPFSLETRKDFANGLKRINDELNKKIKLNKRDVL